MIKNKITKVKKLPGFNWVETDNYTGYLASPEGKKYFIYDELTYTVDGGIEYRFDEHSEFDVAYWSLKTFKNYAENIIIMKRLNKN